ncbi:MAG: hypothetical protein Q8919_10240, partial [Bacteroidota bacterium]|nr:hypothetical protein [Bacteroidota bacterium]
MKTVFLALTLGVLFTLAGSSATAQLKIIADIDTSFAHGGKVEVALSAFGDEVTDFYGVFPDVQTTSKITVCGKVGTADPSLYKIGLIQLNPLGSFDASFGSGGKVITSWGVSSYPNRMFVSPIDSSIIISGMSASSTDYRDHLASLFKFKKNGSIDSSFGGDGHVAVRFNALFGGEFVNIYPVDTTYLACGTVSTQSSVIGVIAMRFFRNGNLDTTYGSQGKGFIPVYMESVNGFLSPDASLTLIGAEVPTDSEPPIVKHIILARFKPNGMPDSGFGKNGVVKTGVVIGRNSVAAAIQPNYDIIAAYTPPEISLNVPWIVVRFNIDGSLDTLYGDKGYVTIGFGPGSSETRGVNIAKNGKATVNGNVSYWQGSCATARINPDGSPD